MLYGSVPGDALRSTVMILADATKWLSGATVAEVGADGGIGGYGSAMLNFAAIALERMQVIISRLPGVEQKDNLPGCYFLVRRKIFAQIATFIDQGQPVTMVAFRPDAGE